MQPYTKSNLLSITQKQTLLALRSRHFNVKSNYKSMYDYYNMQCKICNEPDSYEDVIHTLKKFTVLLKDLDIFIKVKFSDIYEDLNLQVTAVKQFMKIINKRNILLELREKRT